MKSSPRKLRGRTAERERKSIPKTGLLCIVFRQRVADAAEKGLPPVSYYSKKRVGVELPLELLSSARKGGLTRGNFVSYKSIKCSSLSRLW
jgi:hypothetical protein